MRQRITLADVVVLAPVLVLYALARHQGMTTVEWFLILGGSTLAVPLVVLVHELGHGLALVALTPQRALIRVGDEPPLLTFSLGRIDVRWGLGDGGECELVRDPGRVRDLLITLAGPFASALLSAALIAATVQLEGSGYAFWQCGAIALCSLWGVAQLVPFRGAVLWAGMQLEPQASDGLVALRILTGSRQPAPAPAVERPRSSLGRSGARLVLAARDAARAVRAPYIGVEHLLMALLREGGRAALALTRGGLEERRLRGWAEQLAAYGGGPPAPGAELATTPRFRAVVEQAVERVRARGDQEADDGDLLLALLDDQEASGGEMLRQLDVDPAAARGALA